MGLFCCCLLGFVFCLCDFFIFVSYTWDSLAKVKQVKCKKHYMVSYYFVLLKFNESRYILQTRTVFLFLSLTNIDIKMYFNKKCSVFELFLWLCKLEPNIFNILLVIKSYRKELCILIEEKDNYQPSYTACDLRWWPACKIPWFNRGTKVVGLTSHYLTGIKTPSMRLNLYPTLLM